MAIWNIFWPRGLLYAHLVYFNGVCYILPVLLCCTKKNLATLMYSGTYNVQK
jgi:hypothetical protein